LFIGSHLRSSQVSHVMRDQFLPISSWIWNYAMFTFVKTSCIWFWRYSAVNSLQFSGLQVRIGVIYLISGFGGSVLSALFLRSNYISVGASGALFGLLGSMLSELIMNWTIYTNKVSRKHIICALFFSY